MCNQYSSDKKASFGGELFSPQFPVMLRKMWTGQEVQDWLNQLPALYTAPNNNEHLISALKNIAENPDESGNSAAFIAKGALLLHQKLLTNKG